MPAERFVALRTVGALAAALLASCSLDAPKPSVDPTVFQAKAMRAAMPAQEISLVDQAGEPVRLSEQKGKVVLITAVYASCGLACPRILGQAKRAIATLSEQEKANLVVLGVTLDAERDTPEVLSKMAAAQKIDRPLYRLLTGPVPEVEAVLDRLAVERKRNEKTGMIDHSNLFLLVDKQGLVAYRFTLDPLQEKWLGEAMKLLLAETAGPAAPRG
jgi:protein SCO1